MLWLEAAAGDRARGAAVNAWLDARERHGETEDWLADLSRARRLTSAVGMECRYALLAASEAGAAFGVSDTLVAALVDSGAWTAQQGLAHVRRVAERPERPEPTRPPPPAGDSAARLLARLAPALVAAGLLDAAVRLGRTIGAPESCARALIALAGASRDETVVGEAAAAARAIADPVLRAPALERVAELAEAAPERAAIAEHAEALDAARAIGDPHARAQALVDLSEPREALAAARAIPDDVSQVPGSPYTFQPSAGPRGRAEADRARAAARRRFDRPRHRARDRRPGPADRGAGRGARTRRGPSAARRRTGRDRA